MAILVVFFCSKMELNDIIYLCIHNYDTQELCIKNAHREMITSIYCYHFVLCVLLLMNLKNVYRNIKFLLLEIKHSREFIHRIKQIFRLKFKIKKCCEYYITLET